jgi:hypothetical protein
MRLIERATQLCAAQLFGGPSAAVDIAKQHSLTRADQAAALVLQKLNLAEEVLAEHHESRHGGLCAGCLAHCQEPNCAGCLWHKPYPCPLAAIAQAALSLPVSG